MKLKKYLPFIGKSTELMVCETDGFSLSGAVLSIVEGQLKVLHQAKIEQVDMAEAVPELLTVLKDDGWRGGGSAVVLSPAVLSTLVELPVNPKKPRPLQQMQALVKGEVDIMLMQYMMRWSVGHLLVGQGYLTEEQAQAVMDLQQGKPNPAGGLELLDKFSFRRFGELAEELGYIKHSQLTACLTGQEWLKADDDQIECNWVAQGAVEDVPGMFNWLVSCVSQSLLQRWQTVFAKQGVKLTALYPLTGCSVVLLPDTTEATIALESHQGLALSIREGAGNITHQHAYMNPSKSALERCLESYHALPLSNHEPVCLSCWHTQGDALAAALEKTLEGELQPLEHPAMTEQVTPGILGAASHVLGLGKKGVCIAVREGGPLPPPMQRLEVRAAILSVALLFAMLGTELTLLLRHKEAQAVQQQVESRWNSIDEARKRIKAQAKAIKQRKQELQKQRDEQQRLKAMLDFYSQAIPGREALVKDVMGALQSAVSDEVIIISLNEKGKQQASLSKKTAGTEKTVETESFAIVAWALTESAAQTFIQNMQRAIAPSGLEVRDTPVLSSKGPLNLNGFSVKMRLVKRLSLASISPQVLR